MSFLYPQSRFDSCVLCADSREERGSALPDRRATGGRGLSEDGVGGGIPRPGGGARSIMAISAVGQNDGCFGEGRSGRAVLIWFERHSYRTARKRCQPGYHLSILSRHSPDDARLLYCLMKLLRINKEASSVNVWSIGQK